MSDGLITQSIKNLIGGVSQQTPSLRRVDQCEEQVNCRNDPVEGMGKRFNTELVTDLTGITDADQYLFQHIYRDESEQYIFALSHGSLRIFDQESGFEYTVNIPADLASYLSPRGDFRPQRAFQLLNTIDTTFLLNKTVPVERVLENDPGGEPDNTVQRVVTVSISRHPDPRADGSSQLSGDSSRSWTQWYEFTINGTVYTYDDAEDTVSEVASQVASWIETEYPTLLNVSWSDGVIRLELPVGLDVSISGVWKERDVYVDGDSRGGDGSYDRTTEGKTLVVEEGYLTFPAPSGNTPSAIWYVKQADYSTTYEVVIDGTTFSITTPEATSAQARAGLETGTLAQDMATVISANANYTAVQYGSVVFIVRDDGADFSIEARDDLGDRAAFAIKQFTENFEDLPPNAPVGYRVEIRGGVDVDVEPYHVVYSVVEEDGTQTTGFWKETLKYGLDTSLNQNTMPVSINRKQDPSYVTTGNARGIYFDLEQSNWSELKGGDDNTAPFPSFTSEMDVNGQITRPRYIKTMAFHRNRLAMVSDENIIFSEAGEFLNFFPTTTITVLDGDVIDLAIPLNGVEPVEHILEAAESLFLFSPNKQMKLSAGEVFKADSITIDTVSKYEADMNSAPFAEGAFIYFWMRNTFASQLMEFIVDPATEQWTAQAVTAHVPRYVQGLVEKTEVASTENTMFIKAVDNTATPDNVLYVHNYLWSGGNKLQNAWQKWTFNGRILSINVDQDVLYLILQYADDTVSIEKITLSHDPMKTVFGHSVLLDRRVEVDSSFTLPVDDPRTLVEFDDRYFVGYDYEQLYVFSEFFPRTGDERSIKGGRFQLKYMYLDFSEATLFNVKVSREGRTDRTTEFTGRYVGALANVVGEVPVESGQLRVRVQSKSRNAEVSITNDSVYDAVFQTAELEGTYVNRARRV